MEKMQAFMERFFVPCAPKYVVIKPLPDLSAKFLAAGYKMK